MSGLISNQVENIPQPPKNNTTRVEYRCHTMNQRFECDFTWTIQHFTLYISDCQRNKLKSPTFSVSENSCKWFLELSTPTADEVNTKLYLKTYRTELDKLGPITGELQCSLISWNGQEEFTAAGNFLLGAKYTSFGFEEFLPNQGPFYGDKLVPEGELTIHCVVSYVHQNDANNKIDRNITSCGSRQLAQDFEYLLGNEVFSDVTIHLGDKKYWGHQIILASRSPVFKAMLTSDMKEKQQNRIDIDDIDEKTFEEVLRYIYTGKVENAETVAYELVAAADKYDLAELKTMCENALGRILALETVVKMLSLSETYNLQNLKTQTIEFITKNWKAVANSQALNDLKSRPDLMTVVLEASMK